MGELLGVDGYPTPSDEADLSHDFIRQLDFAQATAKGRLDWDSSDEISSYVAEPVILTLPVQRGTASEITPPLGTLTAWELTKFTASLDTREIILVNFFITPTKTITATARGPITNFEDEKEIDPIYEALVESRQNPQPATWQDYAIIDDSLRDLWQSMTRITNKEL